MHLADVELTRADQDVAHLLDMFRGLLAINRGRPE